MQNVSQAWKENQNQTLVGESFVEISFDIADPDAVADASAYDNGSLFLANTPGVVSDVEPTVRNYATLERNQWVLDGGSLLLSEQDAQKGGYISDVLSSSDGIFWGKAPLITIRFSRVHHNRIPAVTVTWSMAYGEYADAFTVRAYCGDSLIAQKQVTGNRLPVTVVEVDIIEYDRITVTVDRWCLPYHRARAEEIFIGLTKVYGKSDIFSYRHTRRADPISAELPKAEVTFSVDNTDNAYDPTDGQSLARYLMQRQEIKTRYGYRMADGSTEWIKGGTFYLSAWDAPQNGMEASFTARDLLEFMSAIYYKGVYVPEGVCLYDLALTLLTEANLPLNSDGSVKWRLDDSLKDIYTTAPLPMDSLANNLQLIANAGGCALYPDEQGILQMAPVTAAETDYAITFANSSQKPEISLSKPLRQVSTMFYRYFEAEAGAELYKGEMSVSGVAEVWITYSGMATSVTAAVSGGVLQDAEYYTNACCLTVFGEGVVSLLVTGTALKSSKTEVITPVEISGDVITLDNPLVTSNQQAAALGVLTAGLRQNRMEFSTQWRADPRLSVLDIVTVSGKQNDSKVRMQEVTLEYNGGFRGTGEGRGV